MDVDDDGNVWASSVSSWTYGGGGIFRSVGDSIRRVLHGEYLTIKRLPDDRLMAGSFAGLRVSDDDGASWADGGLTDVPVRSIRSFGPSTIYVGSNKFCFPVHIDGPASCLPAQGAFQSEDGGATWNPIPVVFPSTPVYDILIDSSRVWAGADNGLWSFNLSDQTWAPELLGRSDYLEHPDSLLDNPFQLYAATPRLYKTAWGDLYAYSPANFNLFKFESDSSGWRVLPIALGYGTEPTGFVTVPPSTMLVFTERHSYRSDDRGITWEEVEHNSGQSVVRLDSGTILSGGQYLYRSVDNGLTWNRVDDAPNSFRVLAAGRGQDVFGFVNQDLYRSQDGGLTWELGGVTPSLVTVVVDEQGNIFGYDRSDLYSSYDYGNSWTIVETGLPPKVDFAALDIDNNNYLYVATVNHGVFRSQQPTLVGVQPVHEPKTSILSVFPNPFSNKVTVSTSVTADTSYPIEVYDLLGRRLASVPGDNGSAVQEIDLSDLPAGMYFIRKQVSKTDVQTVSIVKQ